MTDIQEALNELLTLRAIIPIPNTNYLQVDPAILFQLNYVLTFNCENVYFTKIDSIADCSNINYYVSNIIPIDAIRSYELVKIKQCRISP